MGFAVSRKWEEFANTLKRARFSAIVFEKNRVAFLRKHNVFDSMGENIHWGSRFYPTDAKHLKLHNNITIARGVNFIMHDVIHLVLNNLPQTEKWINAEWGCVEIMDNVAIGSGAQICPNVRIGPNAIVGAGSIVTRDVPEGTVVAGVPARVIGSFDEFYIKRVKRSEEYEGLTREEKLEYVWTRFYHERDNG